jgi:hypothetical protein
VKIKRRRYIFEEQSFLCEICFLFSTQKRKKGQKVLLDFEQRKNRDKKKDFFRQGDCFLENKDY